MSVKEEMILNFIINYINIAIEYYYVYIQYIIMFTITVYIIYLIVNQICKKILTYKVTDYFIMHKKINKMYQSVSIKKLLATRRILNNSKNKTYKLSQMFITEFNECYNKLEYGKEYIITTHFEREIKKAHRQKKISIVYIVEYKRKFLFEKVYFDRCFTSIFYLLDFRESNPYRRMFYNIKFKKI